MDDLIIDFKALGRTGQLYIFDQTAEYRRVYIKNAGHFGFMSHVSVENGVRIITKEPLIMIDCDLLKIEGHGSGMTRGEIYGGMQVTGDVKELHIVNLLVQGGEHGLLMSQHHKNEFYGHIVIEDSVFRDCKKEGIYIGHHAGDAPKIKGVILKNVTAQGCLWDGIQVANTEKVTLERCKALCNAIADVYGQNFNLTINPGVDRINLVDCYFDNSIQFPGQQIFFYNKTES